MALLPKIKLKTIVSFPSNVYGGTGIDVSKTNGNFTINLDYSEFGTSGTLPPNTNALVWDPVTDTYYLVPPSAVGGISDAPSDSKMYGRYNHAWVDAWASPVLTGNPTAPTPTAGDNDTSIATTAFVAAALTGSVAGVVSIGSKSGVITLNGGSMATNELPAPRYDTAQTLSDDAGTTAGQKTQARKNVYAAPFDALAYSGMQINGNMEISQELGTAGSGVTGVSTYIVDGWAITSVGAQTISSAPQSNAPSGFSYALFAATPITPNASPAAGDMALFRHKIEGYRISRLAWGTANAQPITIAFWIFANRTGTYSGSVQGASVRSYPFTFTINASNTWEFKTITIPGDTAGTWITNNTTGMIIFIAMMVGATYQAAAGVWATGTFFGATGTTNGVAATSDVFRITGVVVLPGIEAPSAVRSALIMRPYDQELVTCQRYLEIWNAYTGANYSNCAAGVAISATAANVLYPFKVQKRSVPTLSYSALGHFILVRNGWTTPVGVSAIIAASAGVDNSTLQVTANASSLTLTENMALAQNVAAPAKMIFDARL